MNEIDIYLSAKLLFDQYGAAAAVRASRLASAMLTRGDAKSAAMWLMIGQTLALILARHRARKPGGPTRH